METRNVNDIHLPDTEECGQIREILDNCIREDFRANEMKTVLKNRLGMIAGSPAVRQAYQDCLRILNKEFFELDIPQDITLEHKLKQVRDKIVEQLCPVTHDRSAHDFKKAGHVAETIESLCYLMFSYGYKYAQRENRTNT